MNEDLLDGVGLLCGFLHSYVVFTSQHSPVPTSRGINCFTCLKTAFFKSPFPSFARNCATWYNKCSTAHSRSWKLVINFSVIYTNQCDIFIVLAIMFCNVHVGIKGRSLFHAVGRRQHPTLMNNHCGAVMNFKPAQWCLQQTEESFPTVLLKCG